MDVNNNPVEYGQVILLDLAPEKDYYPISYVSVDKSGLGRDAVQTLELNLKNRLTKRKLRIYGSGNVTHTYLVIAKVQKGKRDTRVAHLLLPRALNALTFFFRNDFRPAARCRRRPQPVVRQGEEVHLRGHR